MSPTELLALYLAVIACSIEDDPDPYPGDTSSPGDDGVLVSALFDIPDYYYDYLPCLVSALIIATAQNDDPNLDTSFDDDTVIGGAADDAINALGGDDTVALGGGRNTAQLGSGDDLAIVVWSQVPTQGGPSTYDGGSGDDTVRAILNAEEAQDADVLDDLQDLLVGDAGSALSRWIEPLTINARFRDFENLEIVAPVLAGDDAATTDQNTAISFNVLDNDLDLLADVATLTSNNDALRVTGLSHEALRAGARLTIDADGTLRFNPGTAYDDLDEGETAPVVVTYEVADDQGQSDTGTVRIVVGGIDDPTRISGKTTARLYEDRVVRTSGAIDIADPDTDPTFAGATATGLYGEIEVNRLGTGWTYRLDNASQRVQRLTAGESVQDVLTLRASDGSTQKISLTIRGANDAATFAGLAGVVTEDGDDDHDADTAQTVTGRIAVTDVDAGEGTLQPLRGARGDYGTFDVTRSGNWTYTLNNEAEAVQALDAGERLRDRITVTSDDGTTARLTVTIDGADEAPPVPAVTLAQVARGEGGFVVNGFGTEERIAADEVSFAGDVNGDGFADIIVSESGADPNGSQSGQAYVVFGKAGGRAVDVAEIGDRATGFAINGVQRFDGAGAKVRDAGDVNGDGLADLFVGAPSRDNGSLDVGRAYVVFGKTDDATVELSDVEAGEGGFSIMGLSERQMAGEHIGSGGDVNGDGLADLIIGDPQDDTNGRDAGAVYVVFGKAGGAPVELADIAKGRGGFVIHGIGSGDAAGLSLDSAGDVNGDGREDLIVNAPGRGASYVVFGKAGRAAVELSDVNEGVGGFVVRPGQVDGTVGEVAGAGDVNGDGLADMILGVADAAPNGRNSGSSFVVFGKRDTDSVALSQIEKGNGGFAIHGAERGDRSGLSVAGAGDTNADGFDDLVIGADAGSADGAAYVVYGKDDGSPVDLAEVGAGYGGFLIRGIGADATAGTVVSGGGDVNGDGLADVEVAAPGATAAARNKSFVVFGQFVSGDREVQFGGAGDNTLRGTGAHDALFGAGGDDRILPRGGDDLVSGGAGDDTIIVTRPGDLVSLTVIDFEGGPGAGDVLELSALGFDNFADLRSATSASGPQGRDTTIAVGASAEITLLDFEPRLLSPDDVLL